MTLTGWLLHVHHQRLEGVQGLKLLLLIAQVFMQQTGPALDVLWVHPVRVFTWNKQRQFSSHFATLLFRKWRLPTLKRHTCNPANFIPLTNDGWLTNRCHQCPQELVGCGLCFVQVSLKKTKTVDVRILNEPLKVRGKQEIGVTPRPSRWCAGCWPGPAAVCPAAWWAPHQTWPSS